MITTVALTYAELGAMFPESGGMVRYSQYSHGSLVGFVGAWANWIAIVSVIPVEAEASVQYMASWHWTWAHDLYVHMPDGKGELSIQRGIEVGHVFYLGTLYSNKLGATYLDEQGQSRPIEKIRQHRIRRRRQGRFSRCSR